MNTEFIVMSASAQMPASNRFGRYGKVALCEVEKGVTPKMISQRARGMVRIVDLRDRLFWGTSSRCAFQKALAELKARAAELNNAE